VADAPSHAPTDDSSQLFVIATAGRARERGGGCQDGADQSAAAYAGASGRGKLATGGTLVAGG
jgi:hypothetical protein